MWLCSGNADGGLSKYGCMGVCMGVCIYVCVWVGGCHANLTLKDSLTVCCGGNCRRRGLRLYPVSDCPFRNVHASKSKDSFKLQLLWFEIEPNFRLSFSQCVCVKIEGQFQTAAVAVWQYSRFENFFCM